MSSAIANSFALLNEIKQELNQPKSYSSKRENLSPSPAKINYSTLISAAANNRNERNEPPTSLVKMIYSHQKFFFFCKLNICLFYFENKEVKMNV
jgi:hypothetical protein